MPGGARGSVQLGRAERRSVRDGRRGGPGNRGLGLGDGQSDAGCRGRVIGGIGGCEGDRQGLASGRQHGSGRRGVAERAWGVGGSVQLRGASAVPYGMAAGVAQVIVGVTLEAASVELAALLMMPWHPNWGRVANRIIRSSRKIKELRSIEAFRPSGRKRRSFEARAEKDMARAT